MTDSFKPLVSVCMITYNHEKYIAQAIESVLMQKTSFKYELVIGEDCSTDGTRAIVCDYVRRYSGRIRLLLPKHNQGMISNFVSTVTACRGRYVALLEGDDYWTDPTKLQRQVDFFESHPDCVICFHTTKVIYEGQDKEPTVYPLSIQREISTIEDLLVSSFIPTCSVIFKNGLITEFPDWYFRLPIGDWPLYILLAKFGSIGYVNGEMSVYRVHEDGCFSRMNELMKLAISLRSREIVYENIDKKSRKILGGYIFYNSYWLAKKYFIHMDSENSRTYLKKSLQHISSNKKVPWKDIVGLLIVIYVPFVYKIYQVRKSLLTARAERVDVPD